MDPVIIKVLIDSGLLKYYTHTVFKYQSFNIIVYFKGDKVIIEWTSPRSRAFFGDLYAILSDNWIWATARQALTPTFVIICEGNFLESLCFIKNEDL
jgi:hypothetical protein